VVGYFALFYEVVDDFVARRGEFRKAHLAKVSAAYDHGSLLFGGALAEPADRALLIFQTDDRNEVEAFAKTDPYVIGGLVKRWEIRPWNVVRGDEALDAVAELRSSEVARMWTARTTPANWPAYREHFHKNVVPELRGTPGYLGASLFQRRNGDEVEILVATRWRSLESIRNFAGKILDAAVVAKEADKVLTDYDRVVGHFELELTDRPPAATRDVAKA
jgi:uncharacterized protein YciI/heme-degrading monooxygenase HmoA